MLNKKLICAATILSLGFSGAVMARGGHHGMAYMASQYDANGDGIATVVEIQAGRAAEFQASDSDRDAVLSLEELQVLMQAKRDARLTTKFAALDTDSSGTLSVAEFQAGISQATTAATLFGLADTNADRALDSSEFAVLKSPSGRVWHKFVHLDTDGNGVISEAEYSNNLTQGGRHHNRPRF